MASKNKNISKFIAVERAREIIDHLSEKELMIINQLVVEKLKYIQRSNSLKAMSNSSNFQYIKCVLRGMVI